MTLREENRWGNEYDESREKIKYISIERERRKK
jgi:hypothetical protein